MTTIAICGRCAQDRGITMPLTTLYSKETKKKIMFCPFCDEERWPGGTRVRIHAWPDKPETVLNIPHIQVLELP